MSEQNWIGRLDRARALARQAAARDADAADPVMATLSPRQRALRSIRRAILGPAALDGGAAPLTAALRGLLGGAMLRPPAWSDPAAAPPPGARCTGCGGAYWLLRPGAGWRCAVCRPREPGAGGQA